MRKLSLASRTRTTSNRQSGIVEIAGKGRSQLANSAGRRDWKCFARARAGALEARRVSFAERKRRRGSQRHVFELAHPRCRQRVADHPVERAVAKIEILCGALQSCSEFGGDQRPGDGLREPSCADRSAHASGERNSPRPARAAPRLHRPAQTGEAAIPSIDEARALHVGKEFGGAQRPHARRADDRDAAAERPQDFLVPDGGLGLKTAVDDKDCARIESLHGRRRSSLAPPAEDRSRRASSRASACDRVGPAKTSFRPHRLYPCNSGCKAGMTILTTDRSVNGCRCRFGPYVCRVDAALLQASPEERTMDRPSDSCVLGKRVEMDAARALGEEPSVCRDFLPVRVFRIGSARHVIAGARDRRQPRLRRLVDGMDDRSGRIESRSRAVGGMSEQRCLAPSPSPSDGTRPPASPTGDGACQRPTSSPSAVQGLQKIAAAPDHRSFPDRYGSAGRSHGSGWPGRWRLVRRIRACRARSHPLSSNEAASPVVDAAKIPS